MGTSGDMNSDEPLHEVTLTRAFYVADREVTLGQFQAFNDDPDRTVDKPDPSWTGARRYHGTKPDFPVQQVNWFDAILFCNWLSRREGRAPSYVRTTGKYQYRFAGNQVDEWDVWSCDFDADGYCLPTEAEWEYACRSGTTTSFGWGNDHSVAAAFSHLAYTSNSTQGPTSTGIRLPNSWGLFDMHGNVWEWCWDTHGAYSAGPVTDPAGPGIAGNDRVIRGGGWDRDASDCRSAYRFDSTATARSNYDGFRVVVRVP
jgi:formylglycine-generating enzyme required for sulfatase activity